MSNYLALARKYRPKTFDDVIGQESVLTAIKNSLDSNRLHHAYLLTGTRGVGKTTLARLFAKSLNCEKGVGSTPCGCCDACRAIEQGSFIDMIEIDAASKTKVEDTRVLLDNISYKPVAGRYKVYIIDEVHMLSKASFNALLKTLEEPPEYVKFILATTDPQNIPVTIVSRCLQFKLKNLTSAQIGAKLTAIFGLENVKADARSVQIISDAANGSMRDALSIADQAIALTGGNIQPDYLIDMLGVMDNEIYRNTLQAVYQKNFRELYSLLEKIDSYSPNYEVILNNFANLIHEISMYQVLGENININFKTPVETLRSFARILSPDVLQLYYQILLIGRKELYYAPNGRVAFDMTLLRMITFVNPDNTPVQPVIGTVMRQTAEPRNEPRHGMVQPKFEQLTPEVDQNAASEPPVSQNFNAGAAVQSTGKDTATLPSSDDQNDPMIAKLNMLQQSVGAKNRSMELPWDETIPKIPLPTGGAAITLSPFDFKQTSDSDSDIKKNDAEDRGNVNIVSAGADSADQVPNAPSEVDVQSAAVDAPAEMNSQKIDPSVPENFQDDDFNPDDYLGEYSADNQNSAPGFEEIPDDYSDEFVQNVPINIDNIIRPYSDKELPHKGTEAKRMMTYSGELPFSDPDEYKAERAIEYVDDPWWLLIKEQIRDELALMILKTTFLEKTETEFKIHITPDNLGMLSDSLKTKIRKDLAEKEPLAEKLVFVEDPDSHAKSPNGLAHKKFIAIKNKMARQLNADKKFTEFIRYFGLNPTLDNLHLIKKADK